MPESASELGQKLIDVGKEILALVEDGEDIPDGKWEKDAADEIWSAIDYLATKRAKDYAVQNVEVSTRTEVVSEFTTNRFLEVKVTNARGDVFKDETQIDGQFQDGDNGD